MQPMRIRPYNKPLDIRLRGERIQLSERLAKEVQDNWKQLLQEKPSLRNGEVFTVLAVNEDSESIHIELAETDYAHYLYSRNIGNLGAYSVRIIHPAALVLAGEKMIFGTMGKHTSLAGIIQCCGGGLDRQAVTNNGVVEIERTMAAELREELGLDMYDKNVVLSALPTYLESGGATEMMVLVYIVKLNQTSQRFLGRYAEFVDGLLAARKEPEFQNLYCIKNDEATVQKFILEHEGQFNEYMPLLLKTFSMQK